MRHEKHLESKNCDFLFRLSAAVRQSCQRSRDLQFLCLGLLFAVMGRASDSVGTTGESFLQTFGPNF